MREKAMARWLLAILLAFFLGHWMGRVTARDYGKPSGEVIEWGNR